MNITKEEVVLLNNYLILTYYAYPLEKKDIKPFFNGIYFDNPRTKEEIQYVANVLKKLNREEVRLPEEQNQVGEGYITLRMLVDTFFSNNLHDENIQRFALKNSKEKNIYKLLAKMWVIVRCENILDEDILKGFFCIKINTDLEDVQDTDVTINQNLVNYEVIAQYLKFFSFLLSNESSMFVPLLIESKYGLIERDAGFRLFPLLMTIFTNTTNNPKDIPYCTFNHFQSKIIDLVSLIGDKYNTYKFKHLCRIIDNIDYNNDNNLNLLSLISIIEMLITHNPANSKFNVEESITRQFIHKTVFLLYENDHKIDVKKTTEELKLAYKLRSEITHGDFESIKKTLQKLYDFYGLSKDGKGIDYDSLDSSVDSLNHNMCEYVRIILKIYLKDEIKLDIIKNV